MSGKSPELRDTGFQIFIRSGKIPHCPTEDHLSGTSDFLAVSLPCDSVKEHGSHANTFLPSGLKAEVLIYIYVCMYVYIYIYIYIYIVCNVAITNMETVRKFNVTDQFSVTESEGSKKFCTGIK